MSRYRLSALGAVAVVSIGVGIAIGCSDSTSSPPPPTSATTPRYSKSTAYDPAVERDKVHKNNPQDWVGVAHNRALDAFFAKLRSGKVSRDVCRDLVDFMSDAARTPGHTEYSGTRRRESAKFALGSTGFCADRYASTSAASSAKLAQSSSATMSPATESMLLRINDAIHGSVDSYELAYRINMMYNEIWSLPGDEAAATYSVASVAVSSAEYWETHTESAYADMDSAYGACFLSHAADPADVAMAACTGLTVTGVGGGPSPTLYRGRRGQATFQLTQGIYKNAKCSYFNLRENVGEDFKGGVMGGFIGAATGAVASALGTFGIAAPAGGIGGAVVGALAGAGVASGASFMWQFAQSLHCTYTGGSGPTGREPSPT